MEQPLRDAVVAHVAESIALLPLLQKAGFFAALNAFETSAIPFHGKTASKLDVDSLDKHIGRWAHGLMPQAQFIRALGGLIKFGYYEQPEVKAQIGYTPEQWIEKVKKEREENYKKEIYIAHSDIVSADRLTRR